MNKSFSNREIAFVLFSVIVGYGVITISKSSVEVAGTGAWISLLIALIISIGIVCMFTYIGMSFEGKTLLEYTPMEKYKIIEYLVFFILYVLFMGYVTFYILVSCELVKHTLLIRTPKWATGAALLIVTYYAVIKELNSIIRICELYGIIIIICIIAIQLMVLTQGQLINVRPILGTSSALEYIKGTMALTLPFSGFIVLFFIPYNKIKNKNIYKSLIIIMLVIGLIYILVVETSISVIGVHDIVHYTDAGLATIRRVEIPKLEILKRLDGIYLTIWLMSIFCSMVTYGYFANLIIKKWLKKIDFKIICAVSFGVVYGITLIPMTTPQVNKYFLILDLISVIFSIILCLILFIYVKVKKNE